MKNFVASVFLTTIWLALAVICVVKSSPESNSNNGGYPDSQQSLGYGVPFGSGGSGYGNEPANYDFQYEVFGGGNFFGHEESRRDKNTKGKYHVLLPDGRRQIVTYVADETGYHPTITYEDAAEGGYPASAPNDGGYGYGAPVPDNSLTSPPQNRYSSRIKREHFDDQDGQTDVVQTYTSENKPEQKFRNRLRRFTPKKGYLIVYPSLPAVAQNKS
ncbi:unnamed protein product [Orchesella dallaii]|uniref:Pro-resilin n=1 Tax=Orchesella dallaii TaxID=48710 RepID=A0ABP1QS27_9HEXA